jgi:hypothetical protein
MVDVVVTDEFGSWWDDLTAGQQDDVAYYVRLLEARGVALDHPYSSAIKGSRIALRELRVKSSGHALRVFYAFDPRRQAVLLLGGDKTGNDRFYEQLVPRVEQLWEVYLREMESE